MAAKQKKRVLFITQEINPYTTFSEISEMVAKLPQFTQEKGMEVRVLMPKFGLINERRHRLHEVVRLSGMNIIVDDDDFPLIIKVASLPGSRLQVYFLDNEEFFKRKFIFKDEDENPFEDNVDRMAFFCKGVMETVKKFGWPPDIIHCHGWMTSLVPFYMKTVYKNEPIFQNSKLIYSAYNNEYEKAFSDKFFAKAAINELDEDDLSCFVKDGNIHLNGGAILHADALMIGSGELAADDVALITDSGKPFIPSFEDEEERLKETVAFYKSLITSKEEN